MTGDPRWRYEDDDWLLDEPDALSGCLRVLGGVALVAGLAFLALFVWVAVVG